MPSRIKCQQCGGLLPVRTEDGIVRCEFCNTEARISIPPPARPEPESRSSARVARRPRRQSKGWVANATPSQVWIIRAGVVLAGVAMLIAFLWIQKMNKPRNFRVGIADMPQKHTGWLQLDVDSIDVNPSKQDAIANLAWVERFAHAWNADAVLTSLDVTVRADGFALDAPMAEYKFVSPSKAQARELLGGADAPAAGLMIQVRQDGAQAFFAPNPLGRAETPNVELRCSFQEIMAAAKASGLALEERPLHKLALFYFGHQQMGWRVDYSAIYIDPVTCALIPSPYSAP